MLLLEYDGKRLLQQYGVPVPSGALVADGRLPKDISLPAVVKAQIPAGKRGKSGGIRCAATRGEAEEVARRLLGSTLRGHVVRSVLVEERLRVERELYTSIVMDRTACAPVLIAGALGGVDVEDAGEESLLRIPLRPGIGLRRYHAHAAARHLGLEEHLLAWFAAVLEGMWRAFEEEEALLVEINPLIVTTEQRLVAADVKIDVDARGKGARLVDDETRAQTPFERAAAGFGAVGVEMAGEIAVVAGGAGVLMATADSLTARGGHVAGLLDLGGFPRAAETEVALFRTTELLRPKVVFFNFFTQVLRCDHYADAIVGAFSAPGAPHVVARLKGNRADEGRAMLARAGFVALESYDDACDAAMRAMAAAR